MHVTEHVTVVHAADIHLDSPLRGLERIAGQDLASRLRAATREALANLIDETISSSADAIVLAGDIYDGEQKDYATGRFFVEQVGRLHDAGVPVILVAGNHDAASVVTRTLTLPESVHVLSTSAPETVMLPDLGVAFHGQGFATRAVVENLAVGYPEPIPGLVNVGVLHTSVAGYDNHDPYAPCSDTDLQSKGYEYFALGHIHARQVVCAGRTTAAFSGNLQGRHVKETGEKGAYWVTLAPDQPAELSFRALDVARWENLDVNLAEAATLEDALPFVDSTLTDARRAAGNRPVVARLTLTGISPVAKQLAADPDRAATEIDILAQRLDVAVERVLNRTHLPDSEVGLPGPDLEAFREVCDSPQFGPQLVTTLTTKINSETSAVLRRLGLDDSDSEDDAIGQARDLLLARLSGVTG